MRGRRALLDLLLDVHVSDPANFSLDDVAEEVDNFMFAGHDTTSSGLGWALYMLGLHPDIQARVHQELDEVLGDYDESVTLDHIKKLKYLDCVLKETRRLYPPTPFIARELEEDVYIDGCLVPAGTSCGLLIYMLHRDSEVFPNPEAFDPDRFLLSSAAGRHPFAYIPFSAGPRNCIGQLRGDRGAGYPPEEVLGSIPRPPRQTGRRGRAGAQVGERAAGRVHTAPRDGRVNHWTQPPTVDHWTFDSSGQLNNRQKV